MKVWTKEEEVDLIELQEEVGISHNDFANYFECEPSDIKDKFQSLKDEGRYDERYGMAF